MRRAFLTGCVVALLLPPMESKKTIDIFLERGQRLDLGAVKV